MYRNIITSHIACELNYLKNLPQSVSGPIINATYSDVAMTTINKMQNRKTNRTSIHELVRLLLNFGLKIIKSIT